MDIDSIFGTLNSILSGTTKTAETAQSTIKAVQGATGILQPATVGGTPGVLVPTPDGQKQAGTVPVLDTVAVMLGLNPDLGGRVIVGAGLVGIGFLIFRVIRRG